VRKQKITEVSRSVVHEVLGDGIIDVDEPIVSYIVNVLADEDFDFGLDGEGAFDALGDLLVSAGCVPNFPECRSVSSFSSLFLSIYQFINQ
jgi:ATP-binding cassette subfamily F protein 3